jgi:3-dehydroquinate dehydratase-1
MSADLIQTLRLGKEPRVVGTIITADYLRNWSAHPAPLPCDLVELRVDGFSDFDRWIGIGQQLEHSGVPVIATIRLAREGGQWTGAENQRQHLLETALASLSGIDVELHCDLAQPLAALARATGKLCILSFHDFQKTAPRPELESILQRMRELGSIAKIAATANTLEDVETLRSLLHQPSKIPICIIGMGPHGRETRLKFPLEGSCLAYGYLDTPGAPGQYSAAELTEQLKLRA